MKGAITVQLGPPTVAVLSDMRLDRAGIEIMMDWVKTHRPDCLPDEAGGIERLFPHRMEPEHGRAVTDAELLAELAGRKCYDSWGAKAGRKTNREYIANTQEGEVPHRSIVYHPKATFFIAGLSRRVSHELIRNYVGADRDEEGSPSQESTRYTEHYGWYVAHPRLLDSPFDLEDFRQEMQHNYDAYLRFVRRQSELHVAKHGAPPSGMERKRIYEAASAYLSHSCETSFIWTTNPIALAKLFLERGGPAADLEFQRLARVWAAVCVERWPNLFPQPWCRATAALAVHEEGLR
jgi:thymidylate synthase (FAD)